MKKIAYEQVVKDFKVYFYAGMLRGESIRLVAKNHSIKEKVVYEIIGFTI